jgi:hypothetical protein
MADPEAGALRARIVDIMRGPADRPDDDAFDALARAAFAWQFAHNVPYAAYCRTRGRTPDTVTHWTEIPAVPAAAFKEIALVAGRAEDAEAVFRTSGTSQGTERRGTHHVLDLSLYEASLLASFDAWLLPDGARPVMLSLVPYREALPDSSLAWMIDCVMARRGATGSAVLATVRAGIDAAAFEAQLRGLAEQQQMICILGTTLSFAHALATLRTSDDAVRLPPGSRLMDTGGSKGRTHDVEQNEMRAAYAHLLGIDPDFCVNEYGMTEMLSQFYDDTLRAAAQTGAAGSRVKRPPAWVRTRVVDPDTLRPVPPGAPGLLQHFDLANLFSVMAIQTEDIGIADDEGFHLLGRALGAPPRGCSIAMDDLLAAARNET